MAPAPGRRAERKRATKERAKRQKERKTASRTTDRHEKSKPNAPAKDTHFCWRHCSRATSVRSSLIKQFAILIILPMSRSRWDPTCGGAQADLSKQPGKAGPGQAGASGWGIKGSRPFVGGFAALKHGSEVSHGIKQTLAVLIVLVILVLVVVEVVVLKLVA